MAYINEVATELAIGILKLSNELVNFPLTVTF
jgi:hypothetical protein